NIKSDNSSSPGEQSVDAGLSDARSGSGHESNLAGEGGRRTGATQLVLLQIPILHFEDVGCAKRFPRVERARTSDRTHRLPIDVFDDRGIFRRTANRTETQVRIEHDPRCGIEHGEIGSAMLREILFVGGDIVADLATDQWQALGSNDVIGCYRSPLRDFTEI